MQIVNKTNAREQVLIAILVLSSVGWWVLSYRTETDALIMLERIEDASKMAKLLSTDSNQSISEVSEQVNTLKQDIDSANQLLADSLEGLIDSQDQAQVAQLRNQVSALFSKHNLTLVKSSTEEGDLAQLVGVEDPIGKSPHVVGAITRELLISMPLSMI